MAGPSPEHIHSDRYWIVALVRAVVALVAAAFITFDADHSAHIGLVVFGAFAIATGIVNGVGAFTIADRVTRWLFVGQGIVGILAGIIALSTATSGLGVLLYLVSVWAALTGFTELYCGLRSRRRLAVGRDWVVVGVLTAVLALVYLAIPPDSVLAVGLFGAYAVIIGVFLAIGAFTLKWGAAHESEADAPANPDSTETKA